MTEDHPHFDIIVNDVRYRKLDGVPRTESLEDCQNRVMQAWKDIIEDAKQAGDERGEGHSLIVAHANTLRALVMYIDSIPPENIEDLNIPTGIPFYYNICKTTGEVLPPEEGRIKMDGLVDSTEGFRGVYMSDDRKKRNFLERRRAANDPWLWALHDDQVAKSMLIGDGGEDGAPGVTESVEDLADMAKEALANTKLFSKVTSEDR